MPALQPVNDNGPDLQFCNLGSFVACDAISARGYMWLDENADGFDGSTLYIEHRYLEDIVLGARADGLVCHG